MTTNTQDDAGSQPGEVRSSDGLGLRPERANDSGSSPTICRWFVQTPAGWLGAWNIEAFDAAAKIARAPLEAEIERLRADRDSWAQQASDRAEDALRLVAAERERCARACEDEARLWEADGKGPATEARLCAARVRALQR